jgi:hypothetical protein
VPIELPIAWVIALNVAGWPVIQLGLAWAFTRMPAAWFNPSDAWAWERNGRLYESVFRIKAWKDRLPDAARWFEGGFAKGELIGRDPAYLRRFIRETWRGELCHWVALGCAPARLEPENGAAIGPKRGMAGVLHFANDVNRLGLWDHRRDQGGRESLVRARFDFNREGAGRTTDWPSGIKGIDGVTRQLPICRIL